MAEYTVKYIDEDPEIISLAKLNPESIDINYTDNQVLGKYYIHDIIYESNKYHFTYVAPVSFSFYRQKNKYSAELVFKFDQDVCDRIHELENWISDNYGIEMKSVVRRGYEMGFMVVADDIGTLSTKIYKDDAIVTDFDINNLEELFQTGKKYGLVFSFNRIMSNFRSETSEDKEGILFLELHEINELKSVRKNVKININPTPSMNVPQSDNIEEGKDFLKKPLK